MSNNEELADFADVGNLSLLSEKRTICAAFHNFAQLPHKKGDVIVPPYLSCHGYSWKIALYPGGDNQASKDKRYISLSLYVNLPKNEPSLRVDFAFRAGSLSESYGETEMIRNRCSGLLEYELRKNVLDRSKNFLDENGTLHVFADIQVYLDKPPVWKPKKSLHLDMLRLLESKEGSDAVFEIDGARFLAHSHILSHRAPALAELVKSAGNSDIPLPGVDPDVFQVFLRFLYTDETPDDVNCPALLELADRFCCKTLKLVVESMIVEKGITVDNCAYFLLFADSHSCAYLRETAIEYFHMNHASVMKTNGWKKVEESKDLLSELLQLCLSKKRPTSAISDMSVPKLRRKLEKKGLDVDGTRKMLIERLGQAKRSDETKQSEGE